LGEEPDIENVFTNLLNILTDTTFYNTDKLQSLSIIDFLLIIIHLRCISIGNSIQLEIKDQKNTKITLNLYKVIEILKQPLNFNLTQDVKNIKIEYCFLSVKDFLFANNNIDNELLALKGHIKKIYFSDKEYIEVSKLDNESFLQLFKALPASYSAIIFKHIAELTQQLNQINILKHLTDKNLSLYLNQNTFTFILQILFSKNLLPLYENIFALAKFANISPKYIEQCTPGEYIIFVKLLESILKEQNLQRNVSNSLPPINNDNPNFM
jgi:hypothetical protein